MILPEPPPPRFDLPSIVGVVTQRIRALREHGEASPPLHLARDMAWLLLSLRRADPARRLFEALPPTPDSEAGLLAAAVELGAPLPRHLPPAIARILASAMQRYDLETDWLRPLVEEGPRLVNLSLTENCTFRCAMCFKWRNQVPPEAHLPHRAWLKLLEVLPLAPGTTINFAGAEPLLYPGLTELVAAATARGMTTAICTNGYLLRGNVLEKLIGAGLHHVALSLDAMDPVIHDRLRGVPGAHARALEAIAALAAAGAPLRLELQPTLMAANLGEIPRLVAFTQEHDHLHGLNLLALIPPHESTPDPAWFRGPYQHLWPQDPGAVEKVLEGVITARAARGKIANPVAQLRTFARYYRDPTTYVRTRPGCPLGQDFLNVNCDGTLVLCPFLEGTEPLGHAGDPGLENLFTSARWQEATAALATCSRNCHLVLNCGFSHEDRVNVG